MARDALRAHANEMSHWTHEPGDDESIRFRLDDREAGQQKP